jgi:hypothetical protein
MDNSARLTSKNFILATTLVFVLFVALGWAAYQVNYVDGSNTFTTTNTPSIFNITVNISEATIDQNITEVAITFPTSFLFNSYWNNTNTSLVPGTYVVSNTSVTWSWLNSSDGGWVINGTETPYYFWFNATPTIPGNYNISVNITNGTATVILANTSVHVNDTLAPVVTAENFTSVKSGGNISGYNGKNWTLNASIFDHVLDQVGFVENPTVYNKSSITVIFNLTGKENQTIAATSPATNNFTFSSSSDLNTSQLADGVYTLRIHANDSLYTNDSAIINFTLDSTLPTMALAQDTAATTQSKIVFTVTITENGSNINGACGVSGCSGCTVAGGGSKTQTVTETGLDCGVEHTYVVSCADYADNVGVSAATKYSSSACGSSGGSGGGSTGGTTGGTTWSSTFVASTADFQSGYVKTLSANERVRVKVSNADHHVGVTSVGADSVTVSVESEPQVATLTVGDSRKFDVTNDNVYDILVTLNSIIDGEADLTITSIAEEITEESAAEEAAKEDAANAEEEAPTPPIVESEKSTKVVWVVLVLVILAVVVFFVVKGKKKK